MAKKIRRVQLATLIIVGEGAHEEAFLRHMASLYDGRETNQKITIKSADGGSPGDIIHSAIKNRHSKYDRKYVLMDSDVKIPEKDIQTSKKNKVEIICSKPICLEGMLLDILDQKIPSTAQACKSSLHPKLDGLPTDKNSYSKLFDKHVLDNTSKEQIITIKKIISNNK